MSRNDKIKAWIFSVALAIIIAFFICGCRTTRYVPVETIVRDTTTYAHWDSIINERVKVVRDSLLSFHWEQKEKLVKDSTYIKDDVRERVDQNGNVVGRDSVHVEIRYRENKETTMLKDSISRLREQVELMNSYKAERDSLSKVLKESKTKVEYKEVELGGFRWFCFLLGRFVFWAFLSFIIGKTIIYIAKDKLHKFL